MKTYFIKKKMTNQLGKSMHVLLTDSNSEILEYTEEKKEEATKFVDLLNANTDSGWVYELIKVGN